ncbi:Homeodomain-like protein, partial [Chytriomyces cf. hyalinus JEL632]
KNNRFKAKDNDLKCLMAVFEKNPFPSTALRLSLAKKLNLEAKQVQFWFQNRRATLK